MDRQQDNDVPPQFEDFPSLASALDLLGADLRMEHSCQFFDREAFDYFWRLSWTEFVKKYRTRWASNPEYKSAGRVRRRICGVDCALAPRRPFTKGNRRYSQAKDGPLDVAAEWQQAIHDVGDHVEDTDFAPAGGGILSQV